MVLSPNDEEVVSSKKTYPIQDWSAQTIPYFRPKWSKLIPKTAKKIIPFGAAHTYIAYIRENPPPPPGGAFSCFGLSF